MKNPEIDTNRNKKWYNVKGQLHRLDGPAFEGSNGHKEWYINGKCHRLDGPAVEYVDGTKYWVFDDKLHRIDGPAYERADGSKFWYINGRELDKEEIKNWYTALGLDINILLTSNEQILFKLKFG